MTPRLLAGNLNIQSNMENTRDTSTRPATKGKHFSFVERQQIERWLKQKMSVRHIASLLGRHRSSVYREIKRGTARRIESDLAERFVYNADAGQDAARQNSGAGGPTVKLSVSSKLHARLEHLIGTMRYSPYAALRQAAREGLEVNISLRTLYRCIRLFNLPARPESLPMGKAGGKRPKGVSRLACNNVRGDSIEKRPREVLERKDAGHWEMDLVVAGKGGKKALLVFTERATRFQIITLLPDKSQKSVLAAFNRFERKAGSARFRKTFKSIACDNGSEFLDFKALEKSVRSALPRTKIYYAHPYASYERGSNENANRLVRRFLPKGSDFADLTQKHVDWIARWMNNYPRRLFGGASALQVAENAGLDYSFFTAA